MLSLTEDGKLFVWGRANKGKRGDDPSMREMISLRKKSVGIGLSNKESFCWPLQIQFFQDKTVVDMSTGMYHSCAIDDKGVIYSWGDHEFAQCGHPHHLEVHKAAEIERMDKNMKFN